MRLNPGEYFERLNYFTQPTLEIGLRVAYSTSDYNGLQFIARSSTVPAWWPHAVDTL
jgi:hypothetical protein